MKKIITLLMLGVLLINCIPCVYADANNLNLSIILDKQNICDGIELIENPNNHYMGTETRASYGEYDGVGCKVIGSTLFNLDSYANFKVDDNVMYNTNEDLYLLIEYYDSTPVEFWIEYDGISGAYTKSESVKTYGEKRWKQAVVELDSVSFTNRHHFGSDFRLVIRYGIISTLPVRSITLLSSLEGSEAYTPRLDIVSPKSYTGIKADYSSVNFEEKNAMVVKDGGITMDVDNRWGTGTKDMMAVVQYYDNDSVFGVSYKKNGEWIQSESFGGVGTGRYTYAVIDLQGMELSGGAEDIKITKVSGSDTGYVSIFDLKGYNESLKVKYGTAALDKNGENLLCVSTDAQKSVSDQYVTYKSQNGSFDLAFNINDEYMSVARDICIELEYINGDGKGVQASYIGNDGKVVKTGTYILSENEGNAFLILEKAVFSNEMNNGSDFILTVGGASLDIKTLRVHKEMPISKEYFNSAKDLTGPDGSIVTAQGMRNWKFVHYDKTSSEFKEQTLSGSSWKMNGGLPSISISGGGILIDVGSGGGLEWTVPDSGTAVIYSKPHMLRYESGSDGTQAVILKNKEEYSRVVIPNTEVTGNEEILQIPVEKGDKIYFKGEPRANSGYDFLKWSPKIILMQEEVSGLKSAKEPSIRIGTNPETNGLVINHDNSSILLKSSEALLNDYYSDTPKIALKFSESHRYTDSEINPVYVEVTLLDKFGIEVWCEYRDASGAIKKTKSITTNETNVSRKVSFCLEGAIFKREADYHFAICTEQLDRLSVSEVRTTQTIPDSYVLSLEASGKKDGLGLLAKASKGVMDNGYILADKTAIELSGDLPSAAIDVENTYAYLNNKNKMHVMLEYFDNLSEFYIEYTDEEGNVAKSETITGTNTLAWRNAVITLPNMSFLSNFDGADFKICATNKDKLSLHSISVSRTLFQNYYLGSYSSKDGGATGVKMMSETKEYNGRQAVALQNAEDMVQFDIDDSVFYGLSGDDKIYNITVTYLDVPDAVFKLTYDAPVVKVFEEHNAETWHIVTTGTMKWKTANFPVSKAYFKNGQVNGADFSVIKVSGEDTLWVSGATVREGYGKLYDVATDNCIIKASSMQFDADLRENPTIDAKTRLFAPEKEIESLRAYDGTLSLATTEDGYDWLEVYFPTLTPTVISAVQVYAGADRNFKVEYKRADTGEWEIASRGKYGNNMSAGLVLITFDPVAVTGIRTSGVSDTWAGGYSTKIHLYSNEPNKKDYHKGSLEITSEKDVYDGEDANFTINYSGMDEADGEYVVKGSIMTFSGRETVRGNLINEVVPANGEKTVSYTLSASDPLFAEGRAYYFVAEVYKDNIMLARDTKLFGRKGISKRENIPELQTGWKEKRNRGTVGQFNYASGVEIPTSVFKALAEDLGYDMIQIEQYWATIEPLPGVYDFTALDANVQKAMDAGLSVSIWLEFADEMCPEWFGIEHTQKDQYGQNAYPRAAQYTGYYADIVHPSLWDEVFIEHVSETWRQIIRRYNGYSSVTSYGMGCVNVEVNIPKDGYRYYDYSEMAQKAYREEYLQKHLGLDLQAVSERYGRNYTDWSEVRLQVPEKDANGDFSGKAWADFLAFQDFSQNEHAKRYLAILDEEAPGKGMRAFFHFINANSDDEMYELVAKSGTQGATAQCNEYVRVVAGLDAIGNGMGFEVHGEPGDIPATSGHFGNPGRVIFNTTMAGEATITWQGQLFEGRERQDINNRQSVYEANEMIKDFKRIGEDLMKTDRVDNEAAVIIGTYLDAAPGWERHNYYSYNNDIITFDVDGSIQAYTHYGDTHRNVDFYNAFRDGAFVTGESLSKYKLVIDRNEGANNDNVINGMAEYVKNGGTLLLFSDSCKSNLDQSEQWPLLKKLGAKQLPSEEMTMEGKWITVNNSPVFNDGTKVWIQNWRDISDWGNWAEPVIVTEDGKKLMVRWKYGAGEVLYCAGEISEGDSGMDAHTFLDGVFDYAGVKVQAESQEVSGNIWTVRKNVKAYGTDRYMMVMAENFDSDSVVKVVNNELEEGITYNVYLAHRDYDELLQQVKNGEWLANGFTIPKASLAILKYTTDRLTSAMGAFNGQDESCWSYYNGDKQITDINYTSKTASDGTVIFTEQTVNPITKAERRWTAPETGVITVKGDASLVNDGGLVNAKILHNGQIIDEFDVDSKARTGFSLALDVNAGDTISFVAENKGDASHCELIWNPHIALSPKSTRIDYSETAGLTGTTDDRTWTAPDDGKIIIQGSVKAGKGNTAAGYILRGIHGKFGHKLTEEMGDYPYFIEIFVNKGEEIHFKTERSESGEPLKWKGNIWFIK